MFHRRFFLNGSDFSSLVHPLRSSFFFSFLENICKNFCINFCKNFCCLYIAAFLSPFQLLRIWLGFLLFSLLTAPFCVFFFFFFLLLLSLSFSFSCSEVNLWFFLFGAWESAFWFFLTGLCRLCHAGIGLFHFLRRLTFSWMSLSVKFRGPLHGVLEVDWAITRSLIVLQSIFHCKTLNWDSGWLSVIYRFLTFLVYSLVYRILFVF